MAHGFNSFVSRSFQGIMARRMNGRRSAISMRTGIFHLYPENGLFLRFTPNGFSIGWRRGIAFGVIRLTRSRHMLRLRIAR